MFTETFYRFVVLPAASHARRQDHVTLQLDRTSARRLQDALSALLKASLDDELEILLDGTLEWADSITEAE